MEHQPQENVNPFTNPEQASVAATYDTSTHSELPSLMYAIPFPKPANSHHTTASSPPFLLYTFPRAVYERPPVDPNTGKRGKEKLIKKVERKWQEEVQEGEEIKRGELKDAGTWKRFKGSVARNAAGVIKYMPNNAIETLGRLPPKKKLGKVTVVYPDPKDTLPWLSVSHLTETELKEAFKNLLAQTRKNARTKTIVAGCLLPVTLAIDIFVIVPLFLFEINMAYFSLQLNGVRKAQQLADAETKAAAKATPSHSESELTSEQAAAATASLFRFDPAKPQAFDRTIEHLYSICSRLDAVKFPPIENQQPTSYVPNTSIVTDLVQIFKQAMPPAVAARHVLDQQRAAEDLDRALKKAAKEYIKTLK